MSIEIFRELGGEFINAPELLRKKLSGIKALLFDWDGIFNSGEKGEIPSTFNEIDSMGINMLRLGFYLFSGQIPFTAIVTGETNQTAFKWSTREHLNAVFFQVKHKIEILHYLEKQYQLQPDEILFVFDDILDLSLAKEAGVRMLVSRKASPLFTEYCKANKVCDYITFSQGDENAIREISELVLSLLGKFDETINRRVEYDETYRTYLHLRNQNKTGILKSARRRISAC